ncbi:tubulin-specific chaperone E-like isoform X2 [Mercenaria mercenaria]|uniref:tubulin-specific chaperone E-like isoform X2 n=1 Tax=Mercenaria mercenaria TaxID=6596 RepID=UPI00234E71DF|nr:tubulin-specific chaperone E-like isoform X2 [Mercenaria mercenaria]
MSDEAILREDGSKVAIGARLECEGYRATLKYIGPVSPTKGIWLGVEWDDPDRGKHDGTHECHTYFKTKHPKSGSFIRVKKANFGVPFMTAVKDRYGKIEDENAGVITEELYVVDEQNQQTVVEMVGARKVNDLQSKVDALKEVALRGMSVYGTLESHDLSVLVPSIEILDLSQNLMSSWAQVAMITKQLKNLNSLNVSENNLELPPDPKLLLSSFSHIKVLFLNRTGYSWQQILQCCDMFPNLEQIHACFNCIEKLSSVEGRIQNVRLVNLESNKISDWSQYLQLGHLPKLETLIASDNGITAIQFPSNSSLATDMFTQLHTLTLNNNGISEWNSINELNKLARLEELRLKSNAILDLATPQTVRQLLIAKLKHAKLINRTEVTSEERKGAEIDYLKRFGPEWVKSGGSQDVNRNKPSAEFLKNHPRFQDLVQIWGAPEDSEMQQQSTSLKNSLITVKIACPSMPDKKVTEKKLPDTMTIQKLKALIYRLYKLDTEIQLSYLSQKMNGEEIELDNDQRFLSYYSIEPGDVIQVKL